MLKERARCTNFIVQGRRNPGGRRGVRPSPYFARSVDPISNTVSDSRFGYFNQGGQILFTTLTTSPDFQTFLRLLYVVIPSPNYSPIDSRKALGNQEVCWSLHQVIFRQFDLGPELKKSFKQIKVKKHCFFTL